MSDVRYLVAQTSPLRNTATRVIIENTTTIVYLDTNKRIIEEVALITSSMVRIGSRLHSWFQHHL